MTRDGIRYWWAGPPFKPGDNVQPADATLQQHDGVRLRIDGPVYEYDGSTRALVLSVGTDDTMRLLLLDTFDVIVTLKERWQRVR
jgi:hypothetical protein